MAKAKDVRVKEKKQEVKPHFKFPLTQTNFMIIGLGIAVLVIGYICMAIPEDPDAFLTRTLSPILLVFAYLVIIPIGLFYREKREKK